MLPDGTPENHVALIAQIQNVHALVSAGRLFFQDLNPELMILHPLTRKVTGEDFQLFTISIAS